MEIHDPDPTAEEPTDPWTEVNSNFAALGDSLKSIYRKVADGRGPEEKEIKDAFTTMIGAWGQVAESLSDALHDPETRDQIKNVASSLATALGSTVSDLGAEFSPKPTETGAEEE